MSQSPAGHPSRQPPAPAPATADLLSGDSRVRTQPFRRRQSRSRTRPGLLAAHTEPKAEVEPAASDVLIENPASNGGRPHRNRPPDSHPWGTHAGQSAGRRSEPGCVDRQALAWPEANEAACARGPRLVLTDGLSGRHLERRSGPGPVTRLMLPSRHTIGRQANPPDRPRTLAYLGSRGI